MLLASASLSCCNVFVSEDLQHRRKLDDLTIINPFVEPDFMDLSRQDFGGQSTL